MKSSKGMLGQHPLPIPKIRSSRKKKRIIKVREKARSSERSLSSSHLRQSSGGKGLGEVRGEHYLLSPEIPSKVRH